MGVASQLNVVGEETETQSKKIIHGVDSLRILDISPEAQNPQHIIHRPHEAQEERRTKCGYFGGY